MLVTLATVSVSSVQAGSVTGLGIAVGDVCHRLLAILGISALVAASTFLFTAIKRAGAAHLVRLDVRVVREKVPIDLAASAGRVTTRMTLSTRPRDRETHAPAKEMRFL